MVISVPNCKASCDAVTVHGASMRGEGHRLTKSTVVSSFGVMISCNFCGERCHDRILLLVRQRAGELVSSR